MYIKTPLKEKKNVKPNRRGISTGKPATWKKSSSIGSGNGINGSGQKYGYRKKKTRKKASLPVFTPWKVILASLAIGVCGILYIGHVFSTQQSLQEVRQLENEFNKAKRQYDARRLEYDRLIGPKEIYQKAREQGYINAGPADQIIQINP